MKGTLEVRMLRKIQKVQQEADDDVVGDVKILEI